MVSAPTIRWPKVPIVLDGHSGGGRGGGGLIS